MRWISNPLDSPKARVLAAALRDSKLKISAAALPVLADLLVSRGITEPEAAARFLSPTLGDLHDPLLMSGMKPALDRLEAALERKEKILIYGDYDVDGTTAIVILKTAIELCGGAADFHVPHRIREGYGMRDEVIERAAADGIRLIISVDTGIRAFAAAETARRTGVDLIVTDHHLPGTDGVPKALVVVNPNQSGCEYPDKYLCGAGVAFKLAQGLMQRRLDVKDQSRLLMSFMKVVAIATIADAVPLLGENRVFAKLGLRAASSGKCRAEGAAGSGEAGRRAGADGDRSRLSRGSAAECCWADGCRSRRRRSFQRERHGAGSNPRRATGQAQCRASRRRAAHHGQHLPSAGGRARSTRGLLRRGGWRRLASRCDWDYGIASGGTIRASDAGYLAGGG
jgi:hypothetical protein